MLGIDFIGLLATICLIGVRYPHYVILATCIHEIGCIIVAVFLHVKIDYIVAAGAFGTLTVSDMGILILYSGSIVNYMTSSIWGGIAFEPTANLINPVAYLKAPFAVVNFRLCILSCIVQVLKNFI